jgi:DNA gyrase subunit A
MSDESYVYTREDLMELNGRAHIFRALNVALKRWDEVSATMFHAASVDSMRQDLESLLGLDEIQSAAVMEMQVRRVAAVERARIGQELEILEQEITHVTRMLGD